MLMCPSLKNGLALSFHLITLKGVVSCDVTALFMMQGIEQIKNEVEDPSEPLIDGVHGHGR